MVLKIKVWQYLLMVAGVQIAAPQLAKLTYKNNDKVEAFKAYEAPYEVRKQERQEELNRLNNKILIDETHIKKTHSDIYNFMVEDSLNSKRKNEKKH